MQSTGFPQSFQTFLFEKGALYVPVDLPNDDFVNDALHWTLEFFDNQRMAKLRRKQRETMDGDSKRGGRLVFQSLKEDTGSLPPVFHQKLSFEILPVRCSLEGHRVIKLCDAAGLKDDLPIHYAQQTVHISKIPDNVVTLDSPLFFKASVLTLFQVHVVLDDANRAQQCWDFWNTYWKRDQHEDNEQILQDAQVIVQALPTWEQFPGTQIQAYDFRKALLGTKKRSMRGSCKFSGCVSC